NATPASVMKEILEKGLSLRDLNKNLVMATFSQINTADSPKGDWLLEQVKDALLIVDEAHIAAGSDSNIADRVSQLTESAWGVVYSSATWLKTFKNLHVYKRAMPESVSIAQVTAAMKRGGDGFGEVFSSMLARDGGLIR